ncbi:DUF421 domain-containing protein [Nocardia sputi]|uniref:DUF421 domain-containing protein n=1 Tax=Nocardia sputi TaxID=2943705 RepID=UPI0020BE0ED4|nr:YetF domain-containing protein [Nocardia sputi]
MWFDSWSGIGRVLLVGSAAYLTLVVVLRVSGKRTLAKLNAFDFVVTVALGSTLATILLSTDVSWLEGAVALILLAVLQFAAALLATRLPGARTLLTAGPTLVLREGRLLEEAMRGQRVGAADIRHAVRATGTGDLSRIAAVVLETDGTLSVVSRESMGNGSALEGVGEIR